MKQHLPLEQRSSNPTTATSLAVRPDIHSLDFAKTLLRWFDQHGRHDLPWQHPRTPYRVWLSEIMLQQTQVSVVIPYFQRFIEALPDIGALAKAPQDTVLALWSGLGYYARARNLHAAARICVRDHHGQLPHALDALMALPGIGRSTAGAIMSQAWNAPCPILDGNVKRVLCRYFGIEGYPGLPKVEAQLWAIAHALLPPARMADYTQAQMDFGATLCTRQRPACVLCPLNTTCVAWRQGLTAALPARKPSRVLPERNAYVLLLRNRNGEVLLQRRPAHGVWASLWSLPQTDTAQDAAMWFATHLRGDYSAHAPLPQIAHGFTHYRLHLQPLQWQAVALKPSVRDNADLRWVAPAQWASLGIPAPIRTLLESSSPPHS